MVKFVRHTLCARVNIRHNLSSSKGPKPLQLNFFLQAEDGIRGGHVTGVQTCALPISARPSAPSEGRNVAVEFRWAQMVALAGWVVQSRLSVQGRLAEASWLPVVLRDCSEVSYDRSEERRVGKGGRSQEWAAV